MKSVILAFFTFIYEGFSEFYHSTAFVWILLFAK